jgi:hypothetical protein
MPVSELPLRASIAATAVGPAGGAAAVAGDFDPEQAAKRATGASARSVRAKRMGFTSGEHSTAAPAKKS